MTRKKKIAILLYAVYALFVTLLLIFGKSVSEWAIGVVEDKLNEKEITDVIVDVDTDTELMAGSYHYIQYTPVGDFRGDAGLVFTSLSPDYLKVNNKGRLYTETSFEGNELLASIRVTSTYDEDFEKIFSFRFVKKYPDKFSIAYSVKGYGDGTDTLYVGIPVYVYPLIDKDAVYNVSKYVIEYDEEYFTANSDGTLIPIKSTDIGESVRFTVKYGDGSNEESNELTISNVVPAGTVDGVMLNGQTPENYVGTVGEDITLTLLSNDSPIPSDYTLASNDAGDIERKTNGTISFKTAGDKILTVILTDGYTQTVTVKIRNKIELPTVAGITDGTVNMLDTDVKSFKLVFPADVTYDTVKYEFDEDMIKVDYSSHTMTLTAKKQGTTEFKLILDDGYERVERTYKVEISRNVGLAAVIDKNIETVVAKGMGHVMIFIVLAILSMNMFRYVEIGNAWLRLGAYTLTALPIASVTEIAQAFIPDRSGRALDVVIDMTAFFIGTLAVIGVRRGINKINDHRLRSKESAGAEEIGSSEEGK